MADISVLNTTAQLSGRTLLTEEGTFTITGPLTFDRDPSAPFLVTSGSAVVANLDSDLLDGQEGTFYTNATNLSSGTVPTARLGTGTADSTTFLRGDQTWATAGGGGRVFEARLTLTSGTAVTTSDVTAATTLYLTPYRGNQVALYTGTAWTVVTLTELSLALSGLTASRPHDIFLDYNAGTPQLVSVVWTSDTARATALTTQDDVLVRTANADHRYVGTIWLDATPDCEDSVANRHVWNYYNRVPRPMRVFEAADEWTYTSSTIRQANANTANQLDFVIGVNEEPVFARVEVRAVHSSSTAWIRVGIGLDSTSAFTSGSHISGHFQGASTASGMQAEYFDYPNVGRHVLNWNEATEAATATFSGDVIDTATPVAVSYGMWGRLNG